MPAPLLRPLAPRSSRDRAAPVDQATIDAARLIVEDVRAGGDTALRRYAEKFGDYAPSSNAKIVYTPAELRVAADRLDATTRGVLERTHDRITRFAQAQRKSLADLSLDIPGGQAGHTLVPMASAGCYAPGGRFPLPSSVLMTASVAKAAGVERVWIASPKPTYATLAAASIAGADGLLAVGGAQAIAALAFGVNIAEPCDIIVGPGNRWVTAAKYLVSDRVSIDMLAGPSELVVLADETADAVIIAADLLAQAEHDTDAVPILVTTSDVLVERVEREIIAQLATLPTAETARAAFVNGGYLLCDSLEYAIAEVDRLAPEHLEIHTRDAEAASRRIRHAGAIFIGSSAAEVIGDYGAGPNHVLPTGGTARSRAGLSVLTFLRARTWIRIDDRAAARPLYEDAGALGDIEGLAAHARSARARLT